MADTVSDRLYSADSLTVVCHNDPDPDSLSAAIALELLAREHSVETVDIVHGGTITDQQNRTFVDLFDIHPESYSEEFLEANDFVAFVDHSRPGQHNPVPEETEVDLVFDHHQTSGPIPADVVDIREGYGATATILAEHVRDSHVEMTPRIAAALLFGIHRERLDFYHQPTDQEYAAATYLHERADSELLRDLHGASFDPDSVEAFGHIILSRVRRGSSLVSCSGLVENHVILAQSADFLLNVDGIDTTLVCGVVRDEVHLSGRTVRSDLDLSACLKRLFGDVGSAGGHADMAGGQIPLDVVNGNQSEERLVDTVREYVEEPVFSAIHDAGDEAASEL